MADDDPTVWVYNPSGRVTRIRQAQLDDALTQGYALPESEEQIRADKEQQDVADEQSGAMGQVGGFIEGVASGATLGGYDVLAAHDASPEQLAKMRARRETTGGQVGEVAGMVAPALVSGGGALPAGAAARGAAALGRAAAKPLARAAGGRTAGRAAAKGVELGVEGAAMGAVDQARRNVTEASLENEELTAEKLLTDVPEAMGYGAAFGGILGLGGAATAEGAKRVGRALTGGRRTIEAADAAEELSASTIDVDPFDEIQGVAQAAKGAKRAADRIRKSPILDKAIDGYVEAVGAARGASAAERKILKDTLKSPNARKDFLARNALRKELADNAAAKARSAAKAIDDSERLAPNPEEIAKRLQATDEAIVQLKAQADRVARSSDELARSATDDVVRQQAEAIKAPAARVQKAADSGDSAKLFAETKKAADEYRALAADGNELALQQADELDRVLSTPSNWGPAAQQMQASSRVADAANRARAALGRVGTEVNSVDDYLASIRSVDAEEHASVLGALQDQADALDELAATGVFDTKTAQRAVKSRDEILAARGEIAAAAERIAPTNVLDDLTQQESQGFFGQYPMAAALATGVVLGPGAYVGARAVNTLAKPGTLARQVAAVESMAERVKRIDNQMTRAVRSALNVSKKAKSAASSTGKRRSALAPATAAMLGSDREKKRKSFKKVRRNLETLAAEPQQQVAAVERITSGITGLAPSLSSTLAKKHVQTVQYLSQQVPQPPSYMRTKRQRDAWEPSPSQITEFARKYRAVTDPLSVIRDVRDGSLTMDAVTALKESRPRLYEELRKVAMLELFEAEKEPSYSATVQLSILFDFPGDATMSPAFLRRNADRWAAREEQEPPPQQPQGSPAPQIAESAMNEADQIVASL